MARPSTIEPATEFGAWLREEYERRGMTQTMVAERSGFRQSTINGYVSGLRVPDQPKIMAIVQALAGKDAEEDIYQSLLNAGLSAAGFRGSDRGYDPDIQIIVEAYSGATESGKRAIKSAAQLAMELSRENSIGGKQAE